MIEETDCTRKLSKYFRISTICGSFRAKNPLAKHDHCIYYAQFFLKCSMYIFTFPRGTKRGNLQMHAKCMFKYDIIYIYTYIYIYNCNCDRISYLNVFFKYFEMFSFESNFAWIYAFCMDFCRFFHLNVIFKMNQWVPKLLYILSRFYVEPLVT